MVEARWGRIINISSISALGDAGRVHYASAKAGLIGFTKTLALELGPHGVTANAIGPGFIVSDMTAASARRLDRDFAEHQRIAAESIPVGRVGQPEDICARRVVLGQPRRGFHLRPGPLRRRRPGGLNMHAQLRDYNGSDEPSVVELSRRAWEPVFASMEQVLGHETSTASGQGLPVIRYC